MSRTLRSNNSEFRKEQIGLNTSVERPAFSNPPLNEAAVMARAPSRQIPTCSQKQTAFRNEARAASRAKMSPPTLAKRGHRSVQVIEYFKQIEQSGHFQSLDRELGRVQELDRSGALLGGGEAAD
jgi:hypothetical protein